MSCTVVKRMNGRIAVRWYLSGNRSYSTCQAALSATPRYRSASRSPVKSKARPTADLTFAKRAGETLQPAGVSSAKESRMRATVAGICSGVRPDQRAKLRTSEISCRRRVSDRSASCSMPAMAFAKLSSVGPMGECTFMMESFYSESSDLKRRKVRTKRDN